MGRGYENVVVGRSNYNGVEGGEWKMGYEGKWLEGNNNRGVEGRGRREGSRR